MAVNYCLLVIGSVFGLAFFTAFDWWGLRNDYCHLPKHQHYPDTSKIVVKEIRDGLLNLLPFRFFLVEVAISAIHLTVRQGLFFIFLQH